MVIKKGDTSPAPPQLCDCHCSTRVANELGGANGQTAKQAVWVVMGLSSMQAIVISSLLLVFRHQWGWLFSSDAEVVNSVSAIMPLLCCIALLDGIQGVLSGELIHPRVPILVTTALLRKLSWMWWTDVQDSSLFAVCLIVPVVLVFMCWSFHCNIWLSTGVARGCGWQELGAFVNLGAFYGVGVPMSAVLAFIFHLSGTVQCPRAIQFTVSVDPQPTMAPAVFAHTWKGWEACEATIYDKDLHWSLIL